MTTEAHDKAFWEHKNETFLAATPDCDLLHREAKERNSAPTLTETQYFGFSVPQEQIHAAAYLWHHPNLGVVSGGAFVFQGIKSHALQSELFDWQNFMSDEILRNDLWDYRFENGYHVQTLEPLKRHRLRYADEARQNSFDLETEALMDPVLSQTGMHFEQAMRVWGELTLRGKTYQVDCNTVRDRSWGQARGEQHVPTPPMDWITGVFSDTFAFGCTSYDHPDLSPEWKGHLQVPGGDPAKSGWICRDGTLVSVVNTRKRVEHDNSTLQPTTVEMVLTDATGRDYPMSGEVVAANRHALWPNVNAWLCLVRWEYENQVCHGDLQEVQWHDYTRLFMGTR